MFRILGGPAAEIDGVEIQLSGQSLRLLGILLAERDRPVATETIIERLWDDGRVPRTASKVVHVLVGRLRRSLEPDLSRSSRIITTPLGYRLDPGRTDLDEYAELVTVARETEPGDSVGALRALTHALRLWRGRPWGEQSAASWLQPIVDVLEEQHRRNEELWGELVLRCGEEESAIERLLTAARTEPLRERRWAQLMLALYRVGRQSEALRAYEEARGILRRELGVEPGPELRRLELAVLQHDGSLTRTTPFDGVKESSTTTSFVGREAEVNRVEAAISQNRVVTLTGLGGVGKTRIATEVVHRRRLAGSPTRWANLGGLDQPERVPAQIAAELGLQADDVSPAAATIAAHLGSESVLLVLDAVELASSAVAAFLLFIVKECPRARMLVTSRVPLGLTGEHTVGVDPLPLVIPGGAVDGTALQLLLDRIGLDATSLDDERRARLESACTAAAGIPLLIELTACSVDLNGPDHTRVRAGSRDHRESIRAAIDSALDEVDESARRLAYDAAPLPGGVSEELAASLLDTEVATARRSLRQLAWTHLAPATAGRASLRYRSLDPVREELSAGLDPDARARVIAAAVSAVRTTFASIKQPGMPILIGRLDALEDEHDNLRYLLADRMVRAPDDALRLALPACEFWPVRGHIIEGRRWLEDALHAAQPVGELRWQGVVALARTTRTFGEVATLIDQLEDVVVEMEREGADDFLLGAGLIYVGMARGWRGDRAGAADAISRANLINERSGTPWTTANLAHLRALDLALGGDFDGARRGQREFALAMEALDDRVGAAMGWYLAATLGDMGGVDDIEDEIVRARELATSHGDLALLGQLLRLEARLLDRTGDDRARTVLREAILELEARGGIRAAALGRRDLALSDLRAGHYATAAEEARIALPLLLRLDRPAAALCAAVLAAIAEHRGNSDTAAHLVRAARDWRESAGAAAPEDETRLQDLLRDLPLPSPAALDDEQVLALAVTR